MRKRGDATFTRRLTIRVSIAALIVLSASAAFSQTHTMPGSNVVPAGASLTINSGGSITAAAGSTVTGFGSGGGVGITGVPTAGQKATWFDATHIQGVTDNALQWDGGSTSLVAATGRTSLGLVVGTNVAPATSGSSILYGNGSGGFSNVTVGSGLSFTTGTLTASGGNAWGGSETGHGNSAYTILATDKIVYTNAAFTGAQTWTLPAASTVAAGNAITVFDQFATLTTTNTLTIQKSASDLIFPPNASVYIMTSPYQGVTLVSDGVSKWYAVSFQPGGNGTGTFPMQSWTSGVYAASPYTLPTSIGATGKMLQSNGSNVVFSTSTWPTATSGSGKIIKDNGSNFVESTETYAAPGTAGNLLTSDGTNWISSNSLVTPTSIVVTDANAGTVTDLFTLSHNTNGTPSIGLGSGILFQGQSSTTVNRPMGELSAVWNVVNDGTRNTYFSLNPANNAGVASASKLRVYYSGYVTNDSSTDGGNAYINSNLGYQVGGNGGNAGNILRSDGTKCVYSGYTVPNAAGQAGYTWRSDGTNFTSYPQDMLNSSVTNLSPSTSDIYVAGSSVVVTAGDFKAKGQYHCVFDMSKTAGTGAIIVTVRIGTTGTVASDAAVLTFNLFTAGTSVSDVAVFDVWVSFRTVGSGTSAVVQGTCKAAHNLATTGMFANANVFVQGFTSSGFNSSTATTIGVSFNGGTAFAGTNGLVQATLVQ